MLIDQYFNETNGKVSFTRQQASDFAKKIADDFNPLHDINGKRFCVPGDLLFSIILAKYGISKHMRLSFNGMVTDEVSLQLPSEAPFMSITGDNGKEYLNIEHAGENSQSSQLIDQLTSNYVTFSGHTFPHILVPLLEQQNVMINPNRPMVMYQSMLIDLNTFDLNEIELQLDKEKTVMKVNGKRGNACLAFNLINNNTIIGRGEKHMLLSGLMPYEKAVIDQVVDDYAQWKSNFDS